MNSKFFVGVILLLSSVLAVEVPKENGVYVLTTETFDEWLNEAPKYVLVEFYAPWCGHCKALAPEYEAAAKIIEEKQLPVALAKVNVEDNQALGQRFEIRGFPTLNFFAGNTVVDYRGGRTRNEIVGWIQRQIKEKIDELSTAEAIQDTKSKFDPIVLLYGSSSRQTELLELSKRVDDVLPFHVTDSTLFGEYKEGDIVVHFNNKAFVLGGDNIEEEIYKVIYPPVVKFTNEHFNRLVNKGIIILAVGPFEKDSGDSLVQLLTPIAEKYPSAGYLVGDSALLARGVTAIGASGNKYPTAVSLNFVDNTQAAFNEDIEFNAENLAQFVADTLAGTVITYKKSEPIPENSDKGTVVLVGKNFDKYVVESGKPTFVKYYAPWCGHCKSLAPTWEDLGNAFDQSEVYIAKIDATANYVPAAIQGYPTLIWYNGKGYEETYEGPRDFESLKFFVNSKLGKATPSHEEL